jgi:hypothetical protein
VEFEFGNVLFQRIDVVRDSLDRCIVAFVGGQFQQFAGIVESVGDAIQAFHEFGQPRPLAAQALGALGIVPDVRAFQFAGYFLEAFAFGRVVKDTP